MTYHIVWRRGEPPVQFKTSRERSKAIVQYGIVPYVTFETDSKGRIVWPTV